MKLKKFLWSKRPYLIEVLNFNFGYGGDYGIYIIEVLTRDEEEKERGSRSLLGITLHRMYKNKKFRLYLWHINILFIEVPIMRKLF